MNRLILVFNFQVVYMFKFLGVISYNNQFLIVGMICDYLIKWFDRVFLKGKFCFYLVGVCGSSSVVIQNVNVGNKFFDYSEIMFRYLVFFCIIYYFYQSD